ncbi:MAG: RNA-binding protein [Hyphomicrobiales bacterium]
MPQPMKKRSKVRQKQAARYKTQPSERSESGKGRSPAPERTCLVTRKAQSEDHLIRFVVSPDQHVVPDLKRKLPGRGVWVSVGHQFLETAVKNRLFSKGFGVAVRAPDDLADITGKLLKKDALSLLSLANRAGLVTSGFEKVMASVVKQRIAAIVAACDASEDGKKKVAARVRAVEQDVKQIKIFTSDEISLVLGRTNVVHAALITGGLTDSFVRAVEKLECFVGESADVER